MIDGRRSPSKLFFRSRVPEDLRSAKGSFDLVRLMRDPKDVVRRVDSERSPWSDDITRASEKQVEEGVEMVTAAQI